MRGSRSVSGSVHPMGCDTAALPGSSFPYYHLSPDCVWDLATTRGGLAVVLGIALIMIVRYSRSPWRRVPPGPRGLPLIGNVLELRDKVWLFQSDCKKKYEDVMYLSALGQPILILNSLKAASELLDRRATIYSGRPRLIMAQEIISGGLAFAILNPVDDYWRRGRRAAHQVLSKAAVRGYHNVLRKEVHDECPRSISRRIVPLDVTHPERFARWKYEGNRDFTRFNNLFESLFNRVLSALSEGSERPSISASLFKGSDHNQLSRQEMACVAGAETTSTMMSWWALAMITHPEVQKRAHIELDTVVGRSRTPTSSDAPNLPYIQAMLMVKTVVNFRPERFLGANGEILPGPAETREEGHSTYGFGKRACMGKHVANESLFIYIAMSLWAVTFEPARDKDGNEVPFDADVFVDTGMTLKPAPYECKITPRFGEVVSILAAEEELLKT
ncbi:cytochrome P450 [Lactarius hatsudake]|nr:cytochrome P450 [Lactarius hatsudake]